MERGKRRGRFGRVQGSFRPRHAYVIKSLSGLVVLKRIPSGGDVGRWCLQPLPVPWTARRARRMTLGPRPEEQTSGKKGGFLCGVWRSRSWPC